MGEVEGEEQAREQTETETETETAARVLADRDLEDTVIQLHVHLGNEV